MFSNLKTKKRLTQLLIAVVAVALTVTGSAFLLGDFVQDAKAYETTVNSLSSWVLIWILAAPVSLLRFLTVSMLLLT